MSVIEDNESKRLLLQSDLDYLKTPLERNKLGQFATPSILAREVLAYGVSLLPKGKRIRFLDPAIGTGSFYSALLASIDVSQLEYARGYEVDPHYGIPASNLWNGYNLQIELADFTKAIPPFKGFNLVICNPPYVRHHHMDGETKRSLQVKCKEASGMRLSGLAGLYCYFLGLSHSWMSKGGIAGWLIPSEFMDVNYGAAIKHYLLENVTLLRIHRFDPRDVQFDDALVSSAVVWFKKEKPPVGHSVEFSYGGTHTAPSVSRYIAAVDLASESKWTRFPRKAIRVAVETPILSDLFTIKRGIATGCNKLFIVSRDKIDELNLPIQCFRPILPSPRYIDVDEIQADEQGNPILSHPLFLLNCRLPEIDLKNQFPLLWRYLQAEKNDVASRYLCKSRKEWYWQEDRQASPFLCTYMGRGNARTERPFRFLLNHSQAIAANTYLMLYPKPHVALLISKNKHLLRSIWKELNAISIDSLTSEGRIYGGGLNKIEPSEMGKLPAGPIERLLKN